MKTKEKDISYCGVRLKKIESAHPTLDGEALDLFLRYVKERYRIHIKKDVQHKPVPYTDDEILKKFRFTNIRREHDRETIWLIRNIVDNEFLTLRQKMMNIILFRLFNKHETMEILGGAIQFESLWTYVPYKKKLLLYAQNNPDYVFFTNAFVTGGMKRALKMKYPKEDFVPACILRYMSDLNKSTLIFDLLNCSSQKEVFEALCNMEGIGDFLAYQIFVDLTYIKDFPFSENEFTVAGPGCRKGIDYLFIDKDGMSYEECIFWIRNNWEKFKQEEVFFDPKEDMVDLKQCDRVMNVMSLENCFCEFSKYYRAIKGLGRPRNNYKPRKEKL